MMKLTKSSRALRRATAFVLAAALTLSAPVAVNADAASKKKVPSLKVKSKTLYYNKSGKKAFTLKIKKNKVKKIVKTKWTTSKKSVAKLSKKKKTSVKVTAKKAGTAKIKATVKYRVKASSKVKTKKLTCKITSKKYKAPVNTDAADVTKAPDVSKAPDASKAPEESKNPEESKAPEESKNPEESKAPEESKNPEESKAPAQEELKVTGVNVLTSTKVNVTFSKGVDETVAAANFTLNDGATVSGVEFNKDRTVATLVVNGLTAEKEYTLTVKNVTAGDAKLESYEAKFTAKKEEYALQLDNGIKEGNVLKADGKASTNVTVSLVNSNGELVKEADSVELKFETTAGNFSNQRVTVQNGVAENMFTSESLIAPKTALITVTIISAKDTSLINVTNTMNIVLDPNPETSGDTSVGATLTDVKVQTADKVALFFNKEVKVTDYTLNNKLNNGNVYGYDDTKMKITVTDKQKGNIHVVGLSAVEGNTKALYAHLSESVRLTDNAEVTVEVTDKTKAHITAKKTAVLQDITNPSVLSVTNNGLNTIVLTFSEAVNNKSGNFGAKNIQNYVLDGIPLNNAVYGIDNPATAEVNEQAVAQPGAFDVKTGSDTKNIVKITLGRDKDGKQIYLPSGKHSIQVSNVGDAANQSDENSNKLITQTLDFTIAADDTLVTGSAVAQSPEQYVITLSRDFGSDAAENEICGILNEKLELQKWNRTTLKYEKVTKPTINVRRDKREYGYDPKNYIVEVEEDWTKVYDTDSSHANYYNDQYRLWIPKGAIVNPANGKANEEISMLLDNEIMKNPDVTSPEIKDVSFDANAKNYTISFSEPVQIPGKNAVAVTPNQRQGNASGVPMPNVAFIKNDNSETIPATIKWPWTYDNAIVVVPTATLTAGTWKVVVYSISDDVGNTAATLVKDDFKIEKDVSVDDFRPLWVVAVPAGETDPVASGRTHTEDIVYVKYSQNISTAGSSANVISTSNYQVNGDPIGDLTKIDVSIDGYNADVLKVYANRGIKDTIAIRLTAGKLLPASTGSNTVYIGENLQSAKGSKIENAGLKTLEKQGNIFTWNYKTITNTPETPLVTGDDVKKALAADENFNITTTKFTATDADEKGEFVINKAMTVDFADSTVRALKIDTQATGTITVKNLNATDITINAPNADVVFEKVKVTGKADVKAILTKLTLNNAATNIKELNILSDVTHDIKITGGVKGVNIGTLNNKSEAKVTLDPFTIGVLNQLSTKELIVAGMAITTLNVKTAAPLILKKDGANATTVTTINVEAAAPLTLDGATVTTLNIKAAASLKLENNNSTITNMNIQTDVKLGKYEIDAEHVTAPTTTVTTGVEFDADGDATGGSTTTNKSDYIADGEIAAILQDKKVELTDSNFTELQNGTIVTTGSAATVTVHTNYNQNAQLDIQLDAGISIKDYKGISFDFVADKALSDQWNKFNIQMIKKEQSGLTANFIPSADPLLNVVVAKQGVTLDANTHKTFNLDFDWTDKANILATQLDDGVKVHLGFQLEGVNSGSYTIKNVKLYV